MFARISTIALFAMLPLLAAATTPRRRQRQRASASLATATWSAEILPKSFDARLRSLLALLGVDIGDLTGEIGVDCSPITVIGIAEKSCSAQPVCCSDNSFHGAVALNCTPANLAL